MSLLDISPGPKVGQVINETITWIIDNNIDINNIDIIHNHIKSFK